MPVISHSNACNIKRAVSLIQMHAIAQQYLQYHLAISIKAIQCLQYRKTSPHISHKNARNTKYRNVCIVTHNNVGNIHSTCNITNATMPTISYSAMHAISNTSCPPSHTQQCIQYHTAMSQNTMPVIAHSTIPSVSYLTLPKVSGTAILAKLHIAIQCNAMQYKKKCLQYQKKGFQYHTQNCLQYHTWVLYMQ